MKKNLLFLSLLLSMLGSQAQDIQISFAGKGASSSVASVKVENLTRGTSVVLKGNEVLQLQAISTGIAPTLDNKEKSFRIYPNPITDRSSIEFVATSPGTTNIELFDITGKRVACVQNTLAIGIHSFQVSGLKTGIYAIKINSQKYFYIGKLVSNSTNNTGITITYQGSNAINQSQKLKSAKTEATMQYSPGDLILFTGTSGIYSTVVANMPSQSGVITFTFVPCTDADGNNYPVVQIGNQMWMVENLRTTQYRNNVAIPNVTDNAAWGGLTTGAYCWYNNDEISYKNSSGVLYNWYAVNDNHNLCPIGWHVPTDAEWTILSNYLGGNSASGGKLKETGIIHWESPNSGATNETGFTALPGGFRNDNPAFDNIGHFGYWWSASEIKTGYPRSFIMYFNDPKIAPSDDEKKTGFSVRCVKDEPPIDANLPTLITLPVSSITSNSAISGGYITDDGGVPITDKGVCWSLTPNPTNDLSTKTNNGAGNEDFSSSISGLIENTTYFVRAYATNRIGTAYGSEKMFKTLQHVIPVLITNDVTSITQNSAVSGGTITTDGGAPITDKGVCWSLEQNPTIELPTKTNEGPGNDEFVSSISGLIDDTDYFVRAYASNSAGTAYGDEIPFHTLANLPILTTKNVTSITKNSAISGGTITTDGVTPITDKGVCWSLTPNPTIDIITKISNGAGNDEFVSSISGLLEDTDYFVRAYATNSAGTAYGDEIPFHTLANLPVLTTNNVTSITQNSAVSGGNITSDGGFPITARGVIWSTTPNPTILNVVSNNITSDGTGTEGYASILTGLKEDTDYFVRAYATNSAGTAYGDEKPFHTLAILPVLTTKNVTSITKNSAISGGTITSDGGTPITDKGVCWSLTPNPTIDIINKTSNGAGNENFSSSISGLTPNTTYFVRAYAKNSAGTNYGNEISFITIPDSCDFTFTWGPPPELVVIVNGPGTTYIDMPDNISQVQTDNETFVVCTSSIFGVPFEETLPVGIHFKMKRGDSATITMQWLTANGTWYCEPSGGPFKETTTVITKTFYCP